MIIVVLPPLPGTYRRLVGGGFRDVSRSQARKMWSLHPAILILGRLFVVVVVGGGGVYPTIPVCRNYYAPYHCPLMTQYAWAQYFIHPAMFCERRWMLRCAGYVAHVTLSRSLVCWWFAAWSLYEEQPL